MKNYDLRILLLEVTQKCNAHCDQCGSRCDINSEEVLTKEEILRVFRDVKENIGTDVMINISGGEPLMRKDLFEIMSEASQMGFDWGMVTNGTLITDKIIDKMKAAGMKTITVSLDGMPYTHEALRHLPGSYDRIMQNLGKLKKAGFLDHLQVTFTSNRRNVYEFPALYRELNRLKIDSVRTSSMDLIGRAQDFQELALQKRDFEYLFDFINEVNADRRNVPIIWGCPHFLNGRVRGRSFECFAGRFSASILYNGDIFVCPNVPRRPELLQGNIRKDRFSDVWKNGFTCFRSRPLPSYCSFCKYSDRCKGDSLHSWDFENDRPKFCYMDIFEPLEAGYRKDLPERYPKLQLELVGPDPEEMSGYGKMSAALSKGLSGHGKMSSALSKGLSEQSKAEGDSSAPASIYLEPSAYRRIREYFHMGEKHPDNSLEQQMVLAGFKLENGYVISHALPSDILSKSARISVFTPDTLKKAEEDVKAASQSAGKKLCFLGFIHSHPVQKALRYSTGDEKIHRFAARKHGDYIGILVNPSRDLIGAYYSRKNEKIRQGNLYLMEE